MLNITRIHTVEMSHYRLTITRLVGNYFVLIECVIYVLFQSWHLHEDQTLLLVTRWVHHCPKSRERNLRSLLTWVQWSHLNPETPIHLIRTHPLYTSSSRLALFFLFDALNEHSLLPADFLTTFSNLKSKFSQVNKDIDSF